MKRLLILTIPFLLILTTSQSMAQIDSAIILSEIMFNPSTSFSNNEFIELFNASYKDTINLAGWKIKYYTSTPDNITDAGSGTKLLPRSYAIIFEGDYAGGYTVPAKALVLKISDNAFGTSGMANTEARDIRLINSRGDTTALYTYSVPNSAGISDEKIIMIASNSPTNWANSLVINGTPGSANSVSPKDFDLAVQSILFTPSAPILNDTITVRALIKNLGTNTAQNFSVLFSFDLNGDSIPDLNLPAVNVTTLNSKDSIIVEAPQKINKISNRVFVFCSINFSLDENPANNNLTAFIEPGISPSSVLISEFMFDPFTGEPEWIEIYNRTDAVINLKNWKVSDALASQTFATITNTDFNFPPKSYLVLATNLLIKNFYDTIPAPILVVNIPTLNNDKDAVCIYDNRNVLMDSVFYFSNWGMKGNSLERISFTSSSNLQSNWIPSFADSGATPGRENSSQNARSYKPNDIVVNEIMYDPLLNNCEYLELLNNSNDTINIAGWKFLESSGSTINLSSRLRKIPPKTFLVLSADSSILRLFPYLTEPSENYQILIANKSDLSLSNEGDQIIIRDLFGNTIDSVFYSKKWHNPDIDDTKGRALERINPNLNSNDGRNWSTSANKLGGTPGKENSIFIVALPSESNLEISPNPFSPDNDGFEDFTILSYKLPQQTAQIRIRIYDNIGRKVRTLADNEPSGPN
ncbi:MAG: lamin tail domain-containing protein, partial [Ignavibacteria bacterium]|nr:lamin tail domain-containing protein [Ignavibacteria bacterium]